MGFANDCLTNKTSCQTTFDAAYNNGEYDLCVYCTNCGGCLDGTQFQQAYTTRCGSNGASCPTNYDDFANCVYQECTGGENILPGATVTTTCKGKGAFMPTAFFTFILSVGFTLVSFFF